LEINYFNRGKQQVEVEQVYGIKAVIWLYRSHFGKLLQRVLSTAPISMMYGIFQDMYASHLKVQPFVKEFNLDLDDFLPEEGRSVNDPYSTFNQFFIRRFKEGKRPFVDTKNIMPAFCEARYFGYDQTGPDVQVPVKGKFLDANSLLAHADWGDVFKEGPLLLARLCPVDYHRYHFPDNGHVLASYALHGAYHSVNPVALKERPDIFATNERHVTILKTENFGKLAYIEVGAMCVGKIIQTYPDSHFNRGDEKGYFLFGGSTVIVIGEKGKWSPDKDILKSTNEGIETYLKLGESSANVNELSH
jgi:phosphatidylserine decarboxylase